MGIQTVAAAWRTVGSSPISAGGCGRGSVLRARPAEVRTDRRRPRATASDSDGTRVKRPAGKLVSLASRIDSGWLRST